MSASRPAENKWRWLGGWQVQVFLFGYFCAWPFWLGLACAILESDLPGYAPLLALTSLMFAGWATLVLAHPSRYRVTKDGIGLRSFCGERWILAREISKVTYVQGEESAGTAIELKNGKHVGLSIAFHGVSIHGEIDAMLLQWGLAPAQRKVTDWAGEGVLDHGRARGRGLEKWESGAKAWALLLGVTSGVTAGMLLPAWFLTTPPPDLAPAIGAILLVIVAIVIAVMVCVGRYSGVQLGWHHRLVLVDRLEWSHRWAALRSRLAMSRALDSARYPGAWAAKGGVLLASKLNGSQPYVPSGKMLLLFSLRGADLRTLEAAAQAVEETMIDPLPPTGVRGDRTRTRPSPATAR